MRHIHKAAIKDRLLHHAVFRILYPIFDRWFIYDSYSCRDNKGTHLAVKRLADFTRRTSRHYTRPIYTLKCDISKFFDSVDQSILFDLISKKINDKNTLWLTNLIINSFEKERGQGLPLGNVTSQLFANIYLNELDQFVKHRLKVKYYLRYCDDFVIVSENRECLIEIISKIDCFLKTRLKLKLHPKKIVLRKFSQGIDFLGYVILPHYIVLRTKTKRRILKRLEAGEIDEKSLPSYLGVVKHCKGFKLKLLLCSST